MSKVKPLHVGIIPDGNRRWARAQGLPILKGHEAGADNMRRLLDWSKELGVYELTLYTFSSENFRRPLREVRDLMKMFEQSFADLIDDLRVHKNQIRIRIAGRIDRLPIRLRKIVQKLIETTSHYRGYQLNFALAYGGRQELVDATRQVAQKVKEGKLKPENISEQTITEHLSMKDEPDLIIRTGGQMRTSNFFPWQTIYSEWFFIDKPWPQFSKGDFRRIVNQFRQRQRRFGS